MHGQNDTRMPANDLALSLTPLTRALLVSPTLLTNVLPVLPTLAKYGACIRKFP